MDGWNVQSVFVILVGSTGWSVFSSSPPHYVLVMGPVCCLRAQNTLCLYTPSSVCLSSVSLILSLSFSLSYLPVGFLLVKGVDETRQQKNRKVREREREKENNTHTHKGGTQETAGGFFFFFFFFFFQWDSKVLKSFSVILALQCDTQSDVQSITTAVSQVTSDISPLFILTDFNGWMDFCRWN